MEGRGLLKVVFASAIFIAATNPTFAHWSISAGGEHFKWTESTAPIVEESGLRWAFDLTWAQSKEPGFSAEYNLKFYVGNVDYTGAFLITGTPINSETHYRGVTNEIRAVYRTSYLVDFVLAGGWDHWRRELSANQEETFDVLYAKLGAVANTTTKRGGLASFGVKYPLYVKENAHFPSIGFTPNPRLHPKRDFSLYGTLGYRFNPSWDVIAYYDSYRFKQSDAVVVTSGGASFLFVQPESKMDLVGVKVQLNF